MALTQSDNAINAYEGFKQSYGNTAMYNALGGDKGLSDAIASGNSGYANSFLSAVMDADKLGSVNSFKSSYRTDFLDNNEKLTAAVNELYGDRITQNEYTRYKTDDNGNYELDDDGNPIEETYYDTEYNYTKSALNERAEKAYQDFLVECEQAVKDGWSGWRKFWSATGSFLMNLGADVLDTIKDDLMFIGVGIESIWNRGALQRYYRNEGEFEGWGAGILSDLMADFDTQYTVLRKADGTTTGVGNVLYGVANTFGVMIPSMLTNLIPVAGAAGSVGAIIGNVAKQSVYWFSLGVGNIKDYMQASPDASFTQICLTSFGVAACQAAVTYVNSFIFGGTFLEKLTLGINTEGGGLFGALSSSLQSLGGNAGRFFRSGIGRFVTDFLIEGTKQWYEEEWQENCQAWVEQFSAHCNNNFNQIFELSGEQYLNAMAMSFLTSFISTGFHYAGVAVKRIDNEAVLAIKNTDILDENGNLKEGHTADELKFKAKKRTVAETLGINEMTQQMTSLTQQLQKILDKYTTTEESVDENGKATTKQSLSEEISEKDQAKIKILTSALVNASQIMGQYYNASGEENFKMAIDTLNKVSESQERLNVITKFGGYTAFVQNMLTSLHAGQQLEGLEKLSSKLVANRITDVRKVLNLTNSIISAENALVNAVGNENATTNSENPTAMTPEEQYNTATKARETAQNELDKVNEELEELKAKSEQKSDEIKDLNEKLSKIDEALLNVENENGFNETRENINHFTEERDKLQAELDEEIKTNGETEWAKTLRKNIDSYDAEISYLTDSYIVASDNLHLDRNDIQSKLDAALNDFNDIENEINDKTTVKNNLDTDIANLDIEIKGLEYDTYAKLYEEKLNEARAEEHKNLIKSLQELQEKEKEAAQAKDEARERITKIEEEIDNLNDENTRLSGITDESVLGDTLRNINNDIAKIKERIKELKKSSKGAVDDALIKDYQQQVNDLQARARGLVGKDAIDQIAQNKQRIKELNAEKTKIEKSLPALETAYTEATSAKLRLQATQESIQHMNEAAQESIETEIKENTQKIRELGKEREKAIEEVNEDIAQQINDLKEQQRDDMMQQMGHLIEGSNCKKDITEQRDKRAKYEENLADEQKALADAEQAKDKKAIKEHKKAIKALEKDIAECSEKIFEFNREKLFHEEKAKEYDKKITEAETEIKKLEPKLLSPENSDKVKAIDKKIAKLTERNAFLKKAQSGFSEYINDKQAAKSKYVGDDSAINTAETETIDKKNPYVNPQTVSSIAELNLTERQSQELERLEKLTGDNTVIAITGDGRGIVAETIVVDGTARLYYFIPQSVLDSNPTAGEIMKMAEQNNVMYEIANGTVFGMYADKLVQLFKDVYGEERIMPADSELLGEAGDMDMKIGVIANLLYNPDFLEIAMAAYAEDVVQLCSQLPSIFEAMAKESTTDTNAQQKIRENVAKGITEHVRESFKRLAIFYSEQATSTRSVSMVKKQAYTNTNYGHSMYLTIMNSSILTREDITEIQNSLYKNQNPDFFSNEKLNEATKDQKTDIKKATAYNNTSSATRTILVETVFNIWLRNQGITMSALKNFYRNKDTSYLPAALLKRIKDTFANLPDATKFSDFELAKIFIEKSFENAYNYKFKVDDDFKYPITHYLSENKSSNFANPIGLIDEQRMSVRIKDNLVTVIPPENAKEIVRDLVKDYVPTDMREFMTLEDLIAMPDFIDKTKISEFFSHEIEEYSKHNTDADGLITSNYAAYNFITSLSLNKDTRMTDVYSFLSNLDNFKNINSGKEAFDILAFYFAEKYNIELFTSNGHIFMFDTVPMQKAVNENVFTGLSDIYYESTYKDKGYILPKDLREKEMNSLYSYSRRELFKYGFGIKDLMKIKKQDGTNLLQKETTAGDFNGAYFCYLSDIYNEQVLVGNGLNQSIKVYFIDDDNALSRVGIENDTKGGYVISDNFRCIALNMLNYNFNFEAMFHETLHCLEEAAQYDAETSSQNALHVLNLYKRTSDPNRIKELERFMAEVGQDIFAHSKNDAKQFGILWAYDENGNIDLAETYKNIVYLCCENEKSTFKNFVFPAFSARQTNVNGKEIISLTFDWGTTHEVVLSQSDVVSFKLTYYGQGTSPKVVTSTQGATEAMRDLNVQKEQSISFDARYANTATVKKFNKATNKVDAINDINDEANSIEHVSVSDATMGMTKSMSDSTSIATDTTKPIYNALQKAIDGIKRKGQPRVTDDYTIAENLTKAFSAMDPDVVVETFMSDTNLREAVHKSLYAACCGEHTTLSYEDFLNTPITYCVVTDNNGSLTNRFNGVAIETDGQFSLSRIINTQYNNNINRRKNVTLQTGSVRVRDVLFYNGNGIALVDSSSLTFKDNINIHNGRIENANEVQGKQITIEDLVGDESMVDETTGIYVINENNETEMISFEEFQARGMYVDTMRNIASNQLIIDQKNDLIYILNPVKDGYEIIVDPLTNNTKLVTRERFNNITKVGGELKIGKETEISQMIHIVNDVLQNPNVAFEIKEKLRRAVSKYIDLNIADAQITTPGNFVFTTKDGNELLLPELSRDRQGNVIITDNSRADGTTFSADDIKYFKMLHPEKLEQEGDNENGIDTDNEEGNIATDDASSIIWAPTKFDKPIEEYLQLSPAQFVKEISSMSSDDFNALRTAFDIYVFKTFKTGEGLNDLAFRQLRVRAMTLATQAYRNNGYNSITITSDEILRFFESQSKDAWAEVDNTILSDYFKARMISDPTKFTEYITNLEFSDLQKLSEKLSSIDIYNRFLDEMTESKKASQNIDLYTNSVQLLHAFIDGDLAFINAQMVSKGMENGLILRSQATEGLELDTEIFATDIANTLVLPHREKVDFVNTLNDEELARTRKSVELYYERVKRSRISPTLTADMLSILNAEMLKRSATKGTIDENWLAKKAVEAGMDKNKLKKSINYNNKNRALWLNLFAGRSFGNGVAATGKSEVVTWDEALRAGIQSDNAKQNALDILVKNILGIADPFISTVGSELNFENLSSPKQRAKGVYADEIANSADNPVGYAKVFDALINLDISTTDVVISKLFGLIFKNIYPGINIDTYKMDYNGYKSVYETLQIRARDAQKANMRGTQAMKEATKNDKAKTKCYSELFLPLMRALGAYQAYSTLITYTREIPMNDMLAQVYSVAFLPTYFKYDFICKYINPSEYGMWYASIKDAIDKMPYTQGARSLRSELSEFLRVFDDVLDSMSASSTMKGYFNSIKQLDYTDINTMYKELTEAVRGTNLHEKINAANVDSLDNHPVEKDIPTTKTPKTLESGKALILPKSVKEYGTGKEYFLTSERIGPRAYKGSTFEKLGFTDPDGVQELWLPLQMQGFIIESNFDPSRNSTEVISQSLQNFIWEKNTGLKKGRLRGKNVTAHREQFSSADMRQYLRTVNENDINDYTFKQINKWFFQNKNIGTMKELTTIAEMTENIWEINHAAEMARRDRNALATLDGIFDPYKKYNSKEVWEILGSIIDKNEYLSQLYKKSLQIYTYYKPAQTTEKTVWVTENGKRIKKTEMVPIEGTAIERSIDRGNRRTVTMDHYTGDYRSMLHIANIVLLLSNSVDNPSMPNLKNATRSGNSDESLDKVNDKGETPANQVEDPNARKTYAKIDKKFTNEDIENLDDMDTWESLADTVQDILDTTSEKGQRDAVFTAFIKEIFITQYRKEVLAKNPQIGEVSDDAIWRNGKGFTTLLKPDSQAKVRALAKQRLSNLTQNQIAKDFVLLWLSQNSDIKFDLKTATAENETLNNALEALFTTNEGNRIQRQSLRSAIIKNIDFVTQYFSFIQMDQLMKDHPDLFVHDEKTGESHFITRKDTQFRSEIVLKKIRQELDAVVSDFHSGKYGTKEWKAALQKAKELQKENEALKQKLTKERKASKEAIAKQKENDNQKYQELLKKHNDLKKQLSQEHNDVRSIQRQIDKTTSVSIILTSDGQVDVPESLVKILTVAVDDLNLTKRQVQLVPESGIKNIALDLEKFFDANAETFSQCTQKDFEAIINFLDTATLGNNFYTAEDISTDEKNISTKVFETYSLWTLAYIMEMRDSGLLDLSEEMNDKLNNAYENKASFAGAYLNAVKQAVDHLHPYAKYVQMLADRFDISVDEQEVTGFALAVSKHIGEKVNRNQLIAMMVPREEVDKLFEKYGVGELIEITETTKPIIVGAALKHLSDDWLTSIKLNNAGHAFDKLFAWEQMCLLSWPGTWIRNISSNIVLRSLNSVGDRIGLLFGKGRRTQEKLSNIEDYMRQKNEGLETPQDYYMYQITGIHPSTEVVDAVNRLFDSVITINPATGKPVTFWNILSDSSSRYSNMMRTTTGRSKANVDRLTELITNSLASKLRAQNRFSSPKQKTVLDKTTGNRVVKTKDGETVYKSKFQEKSENALNKTSNLLFKALSDDPWIKKTTRKYFTRMLTERMNDKTDPITVNNITVENNKVLDIFAEAYSEATWQYMHKKSPMASLDESIKKKLGSGGWFVWKQLMPFANATWNWGMEALNFSPIGIIRGVTQLCRLDRNFIKNDKLLDMGEQLPSGNLALYNARKMIGKGVIGTALFGLGIAFAALGIIALDKKDDKIKLYFGNDTYLDVSQLFGTSSFLAGAGFMYTLIESDDETNNKIWAAFSTVLDSLFDDSIFNDFLNSFEYSTSIGDWIEYNFINSFSAFIPNLYKKAIEGSYDFSIQYDNGILGQLEKLGTKIIPVLAYTFPKKYDIYTGEAVSTYRIPFLWKWVNSLSPIDYEPYNISTQEQIARALGVNKGLLTGNYDDIGKLTTKQKVALNEMYGKLNKQALEDLMNNKISVNVQNEDGTYSVLKWNKMTDKQKASAINSLMTKNASYAKTYVYTSLMGGKYYASENELTTLRGLGIRQNVYLSTSTKSGYA